MGQGNATAPVGALEGASSWNYADEVQYPFGYGLSYTTFDQKLDSVDVGEDEITAKVTVTNTGDMPVKSVVQLYAQPLTAITSASTALRNPPSSWQASAKRRNWPPVLPKQSPSRWTSTCWPAMIPPPMTAQAATSCPMAITTWPLAKIPMMH